LGIPIKLSLINTKARVKINNENTADFKVESGVKQGDSLSATLFSVVVDVILKHLYVGENLSTRLKKCSV